MVSLFSRGQIEACAPLLAEALPLVLAQARELQLLPPDQDQRSCASP